MPQALHVANLLIELNSNSADKDVSELEFGRIEANLDD